jgi:hypothetical protein
VAEAAEPIVLKRGPVPAFCFQRRFDAGNGRRIRVLCADGKSRQRLDVLMNPTTRRPGM